MRVYAERMINVCVAYAQRTVSVCIRSDFPCGIISAVDFEETTHIFQSRRKLLQKEKEI